MSDTGAITPALLHIRAELEALLTPLGWAVSKADTPFEKFNALAAVGGGGKCVVSWGGDRKIAQAGRSLVIRSRILVSLVCKRDVQSPELGKLQGAQPRLFQIHDRVKGKLLALTMPDELVPEAGAEVIEYVASEPLRGPDGMPLDGVEQSWDAELKEVFGT